MVPKWFSPILIKLTIEKKISHRRYKQSLSPIFYYQFATLRRQCKELSKVCYSSYISHIEESISSNPRVFWSFVKSKKMSSEMPQRMHLNGNYTEDEKERCELFARHFGSVFSAPSSNPPVYHYSTNDSVGTLCITVDDVKLKLLKLDPSKGAGPDNIPPSLLKYCSDLLAEPLQRLFSESLAAGVFPQVFKYGYVIPLPKSGNLSDVKNYRPITILSALAKVFESLVLDKLKSFFNGILNSNQHGFVHDKSTVTNLLVMEERVLSAFRSNHQLDAIYVDFAKAFDKVDHAILISKLKGYGIIGPLLRWFEDYLANRGLAVRIGSVLSSDFPQVSGIPQGSHLGPPLFNLFINDLLSLLKVAEVDALGFADDLKLFKEVSSRVDSAQLQMSLERVETWCACNNMQINPGKCAVITFHRSCSPLIFEYFMDGEVVPRTTSIRDLGVTFSHNMNFRDHIGNIAVSANRLLGFVARSTRGINNPATLRVLYCSLVRQGMEYASAVWSPYTAGMVDRLEAVQRRFLRLVGVRLGWQYREVPLELLADELGLQPLRLRRDVSDVLTLYKIINGRFSCPELLAEIDFRVPTGTRSTALFGRRFRATSYDQGSPLARFLRIGNRVSSEIDFFLDTPYTVKKKSLINLSS